MTDVPKQVLACLIEDGGSLTTEQIAEEIGLSVSEVEDALLELQVRKRIKRHEPETDGEPTYRTMVRKDARSPAITPVVTKSPEPCKDPPVPRPKPPRNPVHCPIPGCNFIGKTQQGIRVHVTTIHGKNAMPRDHANSEGVSIEDAADHPKVDENQEDHPDQNAPINIEINTDQVDRLEEASRHFEALEHPTDLDLAVQALQVLRSIDPGATARVVVPLPDGTRIVVTLYREMS